jgi:hypothetical protein
MPVLQEHSPATTRVLAPKDATFVARSPPVAAGYIHGPYLAESQLRGKQFCATIGAHVGAQNKH